jgi:hypothetical protein
MAIDDKRMLENITDSLGKKTKGKSTKRKVG